MQLLSGVVNGHTTGTAIALMIENQNTRSGDYAKTADLLRPGHADFTAYAKYHGFQDARGGGHFSGRVTAALWRAAASCWPHCSGRALISPPTSPGGADIADTPFALDNPAALAAQVGDAYRQDRGLCGAGHRRGRTHESRHPRRRCRGRQRGRRAGNCHPRPARRHRRALL